MMSANLLRNKDNQMDQQKLQDIQEELSEQFQEEPIDPVKQIRALVALGSCLILGLLGLFLFDGQLWGFNIPVFALLLAGSLWVIRNLEHQPLTLTEYALVASGLFFAMTLAWRDSLVLNGLSLLGIFLTMNLAFRLGTRQQLQRIDIFDAFFDLYSSSMYGLSSYYDLITQDIRWNDLQKRWGGVERAFFRGLFITIPLLLIFGYLLITSDTRFEIQVNKLLDWGWDGETVIRYMLTFILCGWVAAAVLRGGVVNQDLEVSQERLTPPTSWKLGNVEVFMMLGALNLLFLSFIAVQFTYFFGGEALVRSPEGPTYANYARHGFFELVTVAVLVITLLLLMDWLHEPSSQLQKRFYQLLSATMVVMTMILEASAAHRMYLYTSEFGMTELRFYTSVFMVWLVVLFIWFTITVLREQRERFTFGAVLTTMAFIGLLHVGNPDARITEFNLTLQNKQEFDATYMTSLSADAVPTLVAALPKLPKSQRCKLWQGLQSHQVLQASEDWRHFNLGRVLAKESLLLEPLSDCWVLGKG